MPSIMEAVAGLDIEVVATLNAIQLADLDKLPDNVRAIGYLPLNQLLPTCSALIHHGGIGTFASAANYRAPQLVTDFDALVLGDPSFQAGAERIYEDLLAMPSPVDLVPVVERLTVQNRTR